MNIIIQKYMHSEICLQCLAHESSSPYNMKPEVIYLARTVYTCVSLIVGQLSLLQHN